MDNSCKDYIKYDNSEQKGRAGKIEQWSSGILEGSRKIEMRECWNNGFVETFSDLPITPLFQYSNIPLFAFFFECC